MEDEEIVLEEETDTSLEEELDEEVQEESIDEIKAKLAKAEEIAENQRIRAEKAEARAKEGKQTPKAPANSTTTADAIALITAKVHEDDIERVERFAKSEGISIKDALKNSELRAILAVRSEERETAEATNVGAVRRGAAQVTGDKLIQDARSGRLPETDADIERLVAAMAKK